MLISVPIAIVFLGLSCFTQAAGPGEVTHSLHEDDTVSCQSHEHMSLLQVQASRLTHGKEGVSKRAPKRGMRSRYRHAFGSTKQKRKTVDVSDVHELLAEFAALDGSYTERDGVGPDDMTVTEYDVEDYDEADEDEALSGNDLALISDLEHVVDKEAGNLSLMSWPWSWAGLGFASPLDQPPVDAKKADDDEPTSLMERPVSPAEVSYCDQKMAGVAGLLRGNAKGHKAHAGSDSWAISKAMFEFLGHVSRKELSGTDRVVCETGFRYGTSAMAFLCMGNATQVRAYSRRQNEHVQAASKLIDKEYPGQLTFVSGDSKQTVRDSLGVDGWMPCDVAFVAGGRQQKAAKEDIANFAKWAKPGTLLMVDSCGKGGVGAKGPRLAFEKAVADGVVLNASYFSNFTGFKKTICMGRYSGKEATMVQAYLEATGSKGG